MMKILIATDSFKGCLTSFEAGNAIAEGIKRANRFLWPYEPLDLRVKQMADGGEGTAAVLASAHDCIKIIQKVLNPVGDPVEASFYMYMPESTAYIDVASASGITLLKPDEIDANHTSTYGTGQLISTAVELGAHCIYLGLGGSATVDLGIGALQALGVEFYDCEANLIWQRLTGGMLNRIYGFRIPTEVRERFEDVSIWPLSDVKSPLVGELGAANVFGPQKGLSSDEIGEFSHQLERVGTILGGGDKELLTRDGAGAAGGIAVGLYAMAPMEFTGSGAGDVINETGIESEMAGADLVITGEGRSDSQTLLNKAPYAIMKTAEFIGVPTILLSGDICDEQMLLDAGFADVVNINKTLMKPENSEASEVENPLDPEVAKRRLANAAEAVFERFIETRKRSNAE